MVEARGGRKEAFHCTPNSKCEIFKKPFLVSTVDDASTHDGSAKMNGRFMFDSRTNDTKKMFFFYIQLTLGFCCLLYVLTIKIIKIHATVGMTKKKGPQSGEKDEVERLPFIVTTPRQ